MKKNKKEELSQLEKEFLETYQNHIGEIETEIDLAKKTWNELLDVQSKLDQHSENAIAIAQKYGIPFDGIRMDYRGKVGKDIYIPESFEKWKGIKASKLEIFKNSNSDILYSVEEFAYQLEQKSDYNFAGWQSSMLC